MLRYKVAGLCPNKYPSVLLVANLFLIVRTALAVERITLYFKFTQMSKKVGHFSSITPNKNFGYNFAF